MPGGIGAEVDVLRCHPVIAREDEQGGFQQSFGLQHVEHEAEAAVGFADGRAQAIVVGSIVMAGTVGEGELVGDEYRLRVRAVIKQHQRLGNAARVDYRLAVDGFKSVLLIAAIHPVQQLRGERLQPIARPDDTPLERRVVGAAALRLVDAGGECAGSEHAMKRFVQCFHAATEE